MLKRNLNLLEMETLPNDIHELIFGKLNKVEHIIGLIESLTYDDYDGLKAIQSTVGKQFIKIVKDRYSYLKKGDQVRIVWREMGEERWRSGEWKNKNWGNGIYEIVELCKNRICIKGIEGRDKWQENSEQIERIEILK